MKKTIRHGLVLLLAALLPQALHAATYYLAANGSDAHSAAQAQNPATPWQSLAKLNARDRKSTRLNSSHRNTSRMPSSA